MVHGILRNYQLQEACTRIINTAAMYLPGLISQCQTPPPCRSFTNMRVVRNSELEKTGIINAFL
jgi:hypothetical protein